MRRKYSQKVAPFLLAGFFLWVSASLGLAHYLAQYSTPDKVRLGFFVLSFFLWGFGFYYWALAKGHSTTHFILGLFPPLGLLVMALLSDKYKDARPDEELHASEPAKNCPQCGAPYYESDYRSDATVRLCSQCHAALPSGS